MLRFFLVRVDLVVAAALNYHVDDMAHCPFAPRDSKGHRPKKQATKVYKVTKKPGGGRGTGKARLAPAFDSFQE